MHPAIKAIVGLAVGAVIVTTASTAQAADNGHTLRPIAGRYTGSPEKYVGGGSTAKAYRNADGSYTLAKLATTETNAYAALIVDGVKGEQLNALGDFSFDVDGYVGGGSPRMNLFWDNNDDGQYDGYALVGGSAIGDDKHIDIDLSEVQPFGAGVAPTDGATVVSLSILVDEQGTSTIKNVTLDGETLR